MSWYNEYKDQWKEIIETVASEEHRTTQMVEKDALQSMFLFELSKSELPFVFKGGTSLSKVYGIIDRFSEDIDLSMSRKLTESEKKKTKDIIISIAESLGFTLANPNDIQSRHSYNKYIFEYISLFSDIPLELIIETSFYQTAYPVEMHTAKSFIGKFCMERGVVLPIPFEAAAVDIRVQSLERTFIDKVFALCDYRVQVMQDRESRHLYDLAKLLSEVHITPELDELIDEVRDDRMKSKNNPSAQLGYNIPEMLKEIISSRFYEADYNNITKKLLYEDVSYDEAIKNGLSMVADLDIFEYKRKRNSKRPPYSLPTR